MTKATNGTAPELIVLGRDEQGKPHAARFPASQANTVTKAAKAMNFTVCKAKGTALADLAEKLRFGRLYATGRGFVPAIRRNLYGKLVEQLKLAGQPVPGETDQSATGQPAPGLPRSWDDIAVGHLVLAEEEEEYYGWWEAIVLARDGDMLTLKWRDWPGYPNATRHTSSVALLKPTSVST
jgi:hypothetical protein